MFEMRKWLVVFSVCLISVIHPNTDSIFVSAAFAAPKKATLGPCVRECMKTFNPGLANSNADQFLVSDTDQDDCVSGCKESYTYGECNFWGDNCCNLLYQGTDPDCAALPENSACNVDTQCADGLICKDIGGAYGSCEPPPVPKFTLTDYMQYRTFDNGNERYRALLFLDDSIAENVISGSMYDPLGQLVPSQPHSWPIRLNQNGIIAEYNEIDNSFSSAPLKYNYFTLLFDPNLDLDSGIYRFDIQTSESDYLTREVNFPGKSSLIPIEKESVSMVVNQNGSYTFEWDPSEELRQDKVRLSFFDETWNFILGVNMHQVLNNLTIPAELIHNSINEHNPRGIRWELTVRNYDETGMNYARAATNGDLIPWSTTHLRFWPLNEIGYGKNYHYIPPQYAGIDFSAIEVNLSDPTGVIFRYELKDDFMNATTGHPNEYFILGMWFDLDDSDEYEWGDTTTIDIGFAIGQNMTAYFYSNAENCPNTYQANQVDNVVEVFVPWTDLNSCGITSETPVRFWGHYSNSDGVGFTSQYPNVY